MNRLSWAVVVASLGCVGGGCVPPGGSGNDGGTEAQFLIHSAVQPGDTRLNYFSLVSSLDEAQTVDYAQSLELPARPRLYAARGLDFVAIGSGEAPTITRYSVEESAFVRGESVSLQPFGVNSMAPQAMHFVSATKAYYKDATQAQVLVIDPGNMTVTRSIPLPASLVKDGFVTGFSQWASREGEAWFAVSWTNPTYDHVQPGAALVRIDTTTDAISVIDEPRCRDLGKTAVVADTLYFFSGVINGLGYAAYSADDGGQQDCAVRVLPGATTADGSYLGSVSAALGEGHVGTVIAITEDGRAWVQAADLEVTPHAPGTTYGEWYSRGWSWWTVPLSSMDTATRVDTAAGAYSGFTLAAGEGFYVSRAAEDYSESTLVNLGGASPADGVNFAGFVLDVAQLH